MHEPTGWQPRPTQKWLILLLVFVAGLGVVTNRLMTTASETTRPDAPPESIPWQGGGMLALASSDKIVYISGEVHQPGVYTMPPDARVHDVVVAAQGLTDHADREQINLAAHIEDAEHIHIPRLEEPPPLVVSIAGEVHRPDVYRMPPGARVYDVVVAAQGLTDHADSAQVNLAAPVEDAQHLFIPRCGDPTQPEAPAPIAIQASDTPPAPIAIQVSDTPPALDRGIPPASLATVVNLNAATAAELETLEGIGTVLSERIIDYRTTHGAFASVEELQNIRGISPAMVETLRQYLTVGHE
ncbi:MAG: hypothetical protein HC884_09505 [Chloroflexaceae bacterium]|nr:hypothetical protein [Chloroflexaceae bacterium]